MSASLVTGSLSRINSVQGIGNSTKMDFQFNPAELKERINAKYSLSQSFRGSSQNSSYNGTESETIPLTLFYTLFGDVNLPVEPDAPTSVWIERGPRGDPNNPLVIEEVEIGRSLAPAVRFLKSLMYANPPKQPIPPPVIFEWPGLVRIVAQVERLELTYDMFSQETLAPLTLVAKMSLRERINGGLTTKHVARYGSLRSQEALNEAQDAAFRGAEGVDLRASNPTMNYTWATGD
jgi:hypothetical protein